MHFLLLLLSLWFGRLSLKGLCPLFCSRISSFFLVSIWRTTCTSIACCGAFDSKGSRQMYMVSPFFGSDFLKQGPVALDSQRRLTMRRLLCLYARSPARFYSTPVPTRLLLLRHSSRSRAPRSESPGLIHIFEFFCMLS